MALLNTPYYGKSALEKKDHFYGESISGLNEKDQKSRKRDKQKNET